MKYTITDLIDLESFEKLLVAFNKITGLPCALNDMENNNLIRVGCQDICRDFHRVNPETNKRCMEDTIKISLGLSAQASIDHECQNGLWDSAIPVIIEGQQIASIFAGQYFHEPPDEEAFRLQARQFGFDEEAYISALRKVPIVSKERIPGFMNLMAELANNLAIQGLDRLRALEADEELQKAEKVRISVENMYRQMIEKIDVVVYRDADDDISSNRYTSPQIESLLGYTSEEWLADPKLWLKIIHPDDKKKVLAENNRTNQTADPFDMEYRMIAKDGHVVWVHDHAVLTHDETDDSWGWSGVITDITERKTAEEFVAADQQRLSSLLKLSQMSEASVREITDFTLAEALSLTKSKVGHISFLRDDETILTVYSRTKGIMTDDGLPNRPMELHIEKSGIWGEAVRQRKVIIANDYKEHKAIKKNRPKGTVHLTRYLNIPVFEGDRIVAIVGVGNKQEEYNDTDVQQLTLFANGMWSVVQRKMAEEALKERLLTLTQPVGETAGLKFEDLFNIHDIQEIQDAFAEATGTASLITDIEGQPITDQSNFCYLCREVVRKTKKGLDNCMRSDAELAMFSERGILTRSCLSAGLLNAGTSIYVGDHHIGNWLVGQVLEKPQSETQMMKYAQEIGVDISEYREAINQVPHMSRERFANVAKALHLIAELLSRLATQNILQARIIAERQNAEEALNQERKLLRTLINNLPAAIYVKDLEGRKTLSNPVDLHHIGAEKEEDVLGKTDFDLFPKHIAEKFFADDMQVLRDGIPVINKTELLQDASGRTLWLSTSKIPLRDEQGRIVRLVGIGRDISESKAAQEALTNERNLMRALIDSTPEMVFVKDRHSQFILSNPATAATLGVSSPDDLIGKSDYDFHKPEIAERFYQEEQALLQTGEPILNQEQWYIDGKGEPCCVLSTKVPWRNEHGEIIGLVGINHDITNFKMYEQNLIRERNLSQSLVENIPDQVYVKDLESRYVLCNYATARNLGQTNPSDVIGKTDFDFHPHELAESFYREEQNILHLGEPYFQIERYHINPNGEKRWFSVTKVPWRDDQGNTIGIVGINRDITERKRSEDEIRLLNSELERRVMERTAELTVANHELEDFAYSVSHDLRSPLRGIDGFSQALLEDYYNILDEEGKKYIERIRNGTQRMGQIIDDLLKLSRVTRSDIQRVPVSLSEMASDLLNQMQMNNPERIVEVIIKPNIIVMADPNLIRVALNNILDNAWKFTAKHATARIEVGSMEKEGQTTYFVRDDGVGFDMIYVNKLFGTFQRLHHLSEFEGTGIGLAIVQRIIQRHGGKVWAEGAIDKGTTIYFTL